MPLDPEVTKDWRKPTFYSSSLTPTLRQAVEQQLNLDADEQTSLFEELALMRVYAGRFVAMYAAACETGVEAKIMLAGSMMQDALEAVAQMCEKAHKLREKQKDRFSLNDIDFIVQQLVKLHYEVATDYQGLYQDRMHESDYREMAALFEKAVRDKIVMPNASVTGTTLHPDETAALFDSSVPTVDQNQALSDRLIDDMRETHSDLRHILVMETSLDDETDETNDVSN